jgi:hypothetical protein
VIRTTKYLRERNRYAGTDSFEDLVKKRVSKQGTSATYAIRPSSFRGRIRRGGLRRFNTYDIVWKVKKERNEERERSRSKNAI